MGTVLDTKHWIACARAGYRIRTLAAFQRFRGLDMPWDDLEALMRSAEYVAKASRSRKVVRLAAGQFAAPVDLFVKRYNLRTLMRLLLHTGRQTRAREEFELGWKLIERGIKTPRPVWLAEAAGPLSRYSLLATEALAGFESALERWMRCTEQGQRIQLLEALGQFTGRMHAAGFYHDDYKARHLLVRSNRSSRASEFYVIDLLGGGFPLRLSSLARSRNLYQLLRTFNRAPTRLGFTPEHRQILLEAYSGSRKDAAFWSTWVNRAARIKRWRL